MKKNLISIVILALLIVNIVMTAIMMFTIIPANKKTISLVGDIASVMNLELTNSLDGTDETNTEVSVDDTAMYDIADKLTITLKKGEDQKNHYALVSVSLCMNTKDKDYKTYGTDIATKESLIKNEIIDVIGNYTYEEMQTLETDDIQNAVLKKIQSVYDSQFIYKVAFRDINTQ